MTNTVPAAPQPQPPAVRPRVRARRGQATDPHSIAERVCIVDSPENALTVDCSICFLLQCWLT